MEMAERCVRRPEASSSPVAALRILVVEDSPTIGQLLEFILRREGYQVVWAQDGDQAQALLEDATAAFDLAVLDIILPYVDGLELLRRIRAKPGWARVPVLMLTSRSHEKDIVLALSDGADDYLVKPFQPYELLARLRRLLPVA